MSLQSEITRLGGTLSSSLDFMIPVETKEAEENVSLFRTAYQDQIEDLGIENGFAHFRLIPSKLETLPTAVASVIFDYLPDEDPIHQPETDPTIQQYRILSNSRRESLSTVVKDTPEYREWLRSHFHLKQLELIIPKNAQIPSEELTTTLSNLKELESLKLKGWVSLDIIKSFRPLAPQLTSFEMDDVKSGFRNDTTSVDEYITLVSTMTRLKTLNPGNVLMSRSVPGFISALKNLPYLTELNFSECMFNHEASEQLVEFLTPNITSLIFGVVFITSKVLQSLSQMTNLTVLDLSYVRLEVDIRDLCRILRTFIRLQTFKIGLNTMKNPEFDEICSVLADLPDLTSFEFFGHQLPTKKIRHLIPIYENHPMMTSLNLLRNGIDISEFIIIFPYLLNLTHLEEIHLSMNQRCLELVAMLLNQINPKSLKVLELQSEPILDGLGMKLLIPILSRFENLTSLILTPMEIEDSAIDYLASLFTTLNLTTLKLGGSISREGIEALLEALPNQTSLQRLRFFSDNDVDDEEVIQMYTAFANLKHLRELIIPGVSDETEEAHQALLEQLPDLYQE